MRVIRQKLNVEGGNCLTSQTKMTNKEGAKKPVSQPFS